MKGRTPTAKEKRYMTAIVELGCCVCANTFDVYSPATIHHCDGKTKPGAHFKSIALCASHHQVASDSGEWATRHGPGRNAGKSMFEAAYGSEADLIAQSHREVGIDDE